MDVAIWMMVVVNTLCAYLIYANILDIKHLLKQLLNK